jgi:hypothetical protein
VVTPAFIETATCGLEILCIVLDALSSNLAALSLIAEIELKLGNLLSIAITCQLKDCRRQS